MDTSVEQRRRSGRASRLMSRFFFVATAGCAVAGFLGLPLMAGVAVSGGSLGRDVSLSANSVSDPPTQAWSPRCPPRRWPDSGRLPGRLRRLREPLQHPVSVLAGSTRWNAISPERAARMRAGDRERRRRQGPGQFLAPTWRRTLRAGQLIPLGPPTVSVADGFATDGDGDGVADPWDRADAVASTARILAADGGVSNIATALWLTTTPRAMSIRCCRGPGVTSRA